MKKELLLAHLRNIPDFPKPGIQFKDVSTLFKDRTCLKEMREELVRLYADKGITKVVGIESRGFVMGGILADALDAGFVMCRKRGNFRATRAHKPTPRNMAKTPSKFTQMLSHPTTSCSSMTICSPRVVR